MPGAADLEDRGLPRFQYDGPPVGRAAFAGDLHLLAAGGERLQRAGSIGPGGCAERSAETDVADARQAELGGFRRTWAINRCGSQVGLVRAREPLQPAVVCVSERQPGPQKLAGSSPVPDDVRYPPGDPYMPVHKGRHPRRCIQAFTKGTP